MTIQAFQQNVVDSSLYGEILAYVNSIRVYQKIEQNYRGAIYQSVLAKRLPARNPIEKHIIKLFLEENKRSFDYDLYGTFEIQVMKYLPGNGYDWHCDYGVSEHPLGDRKLSMILQLSHPWDYTGGEVEVVDWYNRTHTMQRECGASMVFDSRTPHRVRPIKSGERYSITAWAHGPSLR